MNFYLKHKEYAALSPQIRLYYDKDKIWNCGGILKRGARHYLYPKCPTTSLPDKEYLEASFLTGCALLFDYKRTGMLTEQFFYGEEDFEFALRLRSKNMKMACLLTSVIYHKVGRSIKKNKNSIAVNHIHYLNRLIDYKQYSKSGLYYNIWVVKNMADLYFYLRKSENLTHSQRIKVIKNIIIDSRKYTGVDKKLFLEIMGKYV